MRRLVLALAALAATALVVVPMAFAKHSHHLSHGQKVRAWEHKFHFKLTHANRNRDADHDGVNNAAECAHGTTPRHKDNHTTTNATVKSFTPATATAAAVLVISLPDGTTETGQVTDRTEIKCRTAPPVMTTPTTATTPATTPATTRHGGGDDGNRGGGDDNGDDNGVDAPPHNQGDDNGQQGTPSQPGSDDRGRGHDNDNGDDDNQANCGTADLTLNAAIHEARLRVGSGGAVWDEIVLVKTAA
jgi:hypothetical protein